MMIKLTDLYIVFILHAMFCPQERIVASQQADAAIAELNARVLALETSFESFAAGSRGTIQRDSSEKVDPEKLKAVAAEKVDP